MRRTRAGAREPHAGQEGEERGRVRVVVEGVEPEIDCGTFPAKRSLGEDMVVEADVFTDGHDLVSCALLYRREGEADWQEAAMRPLGNDRWHGRFRPTELGRYEYTLIGWVDHFKTWRGDMEKRVAAGQDVAVDLRIGARLVAAAAERAAGEDAAELARYAAQLSDEKAAQAERSALALSADLAARVARVPDLTFATRYERVLTVWVEPERAGFSAWYEFFPRSAGTRGRHGTFRDAERMLPYVAGMGFDVVYLPPIHPIGRTYRKGKNNSLAPEPADAGSPWAIGGEDGGHKAVHPELGTLEDFRRFVTAAGEHGLEVALDIAFQASPDHPYVREHPEWFRQRPDGTIQYAENPPKKYQDIYPFDFESRDWQALWEELRSVFLFWREQGVRIFRVDNPHTKAFPFWAWCIDSLKREHPELIFLSEAFTRPRVMYRLAKLGFTQSYTYFAWRRTKWELMEYLRELTTTEVREYFRPNFWPNTPDILTDQLQAGGRPIFMQRLVLAATLASNYGIYGPAYELLEHLPREPDSEEYLDSEKYQLREWDLERADSLRHFITRVNRIRRENPALHANRSLRFHRIDNDQILAYSKEAGSWQRAAGSEAGPRSEAAARRPLLAGEEATGPGNLILTCVNLDPHHTQSGWVELPLHDWRIGPDEPFHVHDLLTGARYIWTGAWNYVELDPLSAPAHILRIERRARTEADFEYFM